MNNQVQGRLPRSAAGEQMATSTAHCRTIAIVLAGLACSACSSTSPLAQYLTEERFEAFTPPRTGDGVGTIIDFKDGHENTVASPDPPLSQCMTAERVPRGNPIQVALPVRKYDANQSMSFDLNLAKGLVKNLDMTAAFSDKRVRKVSIELGDAQKWRITRDSIRDYITKLDKKDQCYANMVDPENWVISEVLEVKSLKYSLLDEKDQKISLSATIMELLKLSPELANKYSGSDALVFPTSIFVGYHAWKAVEAPGAVKTTIEVRDAGMEELKRAKNLK